MERPDAWVPPRWAAVWWDSPPEPRHGAAVVGGERMLTCLQGSRKTAGPTPRQVPTTAHWRAGVLRVHFAAPRTSRPALAVPRLRRPFLTELRDLTLLGILPGMGSRERRERERVETRERILAAARDRFVTRGVDATTMRAIASDIEYTPTAIYHHFESKEALLTELCDRDFRALAAAFQKIGRIEDPLERIVRIGEAYVEFALENPMQYRFMFMTPRPEPMSTVRRGDPTEDAYAFLRDTCAEAIVSGRFRPEFDDADELAQMLWGSTHGLISIRIAKEHDAWVQFRDTRRTTARLRQVLLRGLTIDRD
jgi:AcrR family transcriptional regulator